MDLTKDSSPSLAENNDKNTALYIRQKNLLDTFLEHGAISRAQYDKSLHDLTVKMGMTESMRTDGSTPAVNHTDK